MKNENEPRRYVGSYPLNGVKSFTPSINIVVKCPDCEESWTYGVADLCIAPEPHVQFVEECKFCAYRFTVKLAIELRAYITVQEGLCQD